MVAVSGIAGNKRFAKIGLSTLEGGGFLVRFLLRTANFLIIHEFLKKPRRD